MVYRRLRCFARWLTIVTLGLIGGLVPTAQAVDLTASSTAPTITFDDTDLAGIEWQIVSNVSTFGVQSWKLADAKNASTVLDFASQGTNADKSVVVDLNGDLSLADGKVFIDRSSGHVGIGTTIPADDLHIVGLLPTLRLTAVTIGEGSTSWRLLSATGIAFKDESNNTFPFQIGANVPTNTLLLQNDPNNPSVGRVGIGTATPGGNLHIFGPGTADVFNAIGPNPAANGNAFNFGYSGASFGLGSGFFNVRPAPGSLAPNPSLRFATANVQRMIIDNLGNVGIGQFGASPGNPDVAPVAKLHVQGNIRADGVFISNETQLTVPDYVFAPDYKLRPLSELAVYIKQEQHLPEIPSAATIKAQGVNLSELQMQLLKKIEELTLYTIQQEETITRQEHVNQQQEQTIGELRHMKQEYTQTIVELRRRLDALEQQAERPDTLR
ncbi:MAG: hypothetical protein FJ147_24660 [Deltaproteobacteria bacterium]|nr:hypothetical protein [Deltaproteobacteria bacterium]